MYNPILEREEAKKYNSMDWSEKQKFHIKLRKKHIRKLLDTKHTPNWKEPKEKEYKNLGALVEWLILDYVLKRNTENISHCRAVNDMLKEEIKTLKK